MRASRRCWIVLKRDMVSRQRARQSRCKLLGLSVSWTAFKRLHLKMAIAAASASTNAPTNVVSLETSPSTAPHPCLPLPLFPSFDTQVHTVAYPICSLSSCESSLTSVCVEFGLSNGRHSRRPGANQGHWKEIIHESCSALLTGRWFRTFFENRNSMINLQLELYNLQLKLSSY